MADFSPELGGLLSPFSRLCLQKLKPVSQTLHQGRNSSPEENVVDSFPKPILPLLKNSDILVKTPSLKEGRLCVLGVEREAGSTPGIFQDICPVLFLQQQRGCRVSGGGTTRSRALSLQESASEAWWDPGSY